MVSVEQAILISRTYHYGYRHIHWCHLGKRQLGSILELGSKRDLGSDNMDDIRHTGPQKYQMDTKGHELSYIHGDGFRKSAYDILWSELPLGRHAFVCMMKSEVTGSVKTVGAHILLWQSYRLDEIFKFREFQ